MTFDYIIKNGLIIDGSGAPATKGDVGVVGDRIKAVGDLSAAQAAKIFDANGAIIAPGFIDTHTHADGSVFVDSRFESQIRQGVTTQVMGLCGTGLAPANEALLAGLRGMFPVTQDLNWSTFAEFLDVVEKANPSTNLASFTGHGSLRYLGMNDFKCARAASDDEIKLMVKSFEQSLDEGSFGLSTGLEYHPGKEATLFELEQICSVLPRYDAIHSSHVRNRDVYALLGFAEVIDVARKSKSRVNISHVNPKYGRAGSTMEVLLSVLNHLRNDGIFASLDVMCTGRNFSSSMANMPSWANNLSADELTELFKSPEGRKKLQDNPAPLWMLTHEEKWEQLYLISSEKNNELIGKTIAEIAEIKSCSGWDAICQLTLEEAPNFNGVMLAGNAFAESDIIAALSDPWCSVVSDSMPTGIDGPMAKSGIGPNAFVWVGEFLKGYCLDKKVISIEEAIKRLTLVPATQIGIKERGLLKEGYYADITVLRPEELPHTYEIKNPKAYSDGVKFVMVNGVPALENGVRSANQNGMVLRKTK